MKSVASFVPWYDGALRLSITISVYQSLPWEIHLTLMVPNPECEQAAWVITLAAWWSVYIRMCILWGGATSYIHNLYTHGYIREKHIDISILKTKSFQNNVISTKCTWLFTTRDCYSWQARSGFWLWINRMSAKPMSVQQAIITHFIIILLSKLNALVLQTVMGSFRKQLYLVSILNRL